MNTPIYKDTMVKAIAVGLPESFIPTVDRAAAAQKISRSKLVVKALSAYLGVDVSRNNVTTPDLVD
ncbi:MAG: hypothetical protein HLUCCA11_21270 [Phormidesmis priestleyi Ana]|uniref:Ribbon-helix-helix protein, copG family n=1 Tax=Phormidesmis priestleyi Ana TaxID=1666911 RepID=A0A0P7ZD23_9CYAN|nr:MAG: hypothetical protein HLUCCA11_21270 [Phormidesmis priestleyi Ana]